ncbi:MAG: VOC family protein [Corynebacterium variabile]|uniref:VOC family protein n=1 Tax=Corynebacterium variabile TaxID=1727 RepID=UPI003F906B5C
MNNRDNNKSTGTQSLTVGEVAEILVDSVGFWTRALGFFELFSVPGVMVHLRRWAFQDVLLVAEPPEEGAAEELRGSPALSLAFACVRNQIDEIAGVCAAESPGCASAPVDTPWNTRDLHVSAPDGVYVVMTAAKPYDPDSAAAHNLAEIGITPPEDHDE